MGGPPRGRAGPAVAWAAPPPRALPRAPVPERIRAPRDGRRLWTCRAGFEPHLYEELAWVGARPELVGPSLVESSPAPAPPTFARAGFTVAATIRGAGPASEEALARALERAAGGRPLHLQAWTPDSPAANPLASRAAALAAAVEGRLRHAGVTLLPSAEVAREAAALLAQLCVPEPDLCIAGLEPAREALSLAPGGRARMWREAGPSRAVLKLEEALDLYGVAPGPGERCVDLGAAPGGWSDRLLARGARVIAVDPACLAPSLERHPRLRHIQESAFAFVPDEPADWLFCDMAWRPLEVAQLLAKWGRRGWASQLVANLKLPMRDKNPVLFRARRLLEDEGGWRHLVARQLYHDRDEVTVMARRL